LGDLVAAARDQALADDPQWLALLHYAPPRRFRRRESYAQSPLFFLASGGARDASAELEATLAAFIENPIVREPERVRCTFAARFAWLDERLGFDPERMPMPECPEFARWRRDLGPAMAASLVFADSYMNNPSSMFGHTLIRFDRIPVGSDEERGDLLAYAVNFAAATGADQGMLYAVRGIIGSYPAYYALLPYYEKVRQYRDWESRDLWEYPLQISQERIEFLLLHIWELQGVAFPYYFFTQNCSYHLLGLLEVARPELSLRARFGTTTIPIDSVRAAISNVGLAEAPRFRGSAASKLVVQAEALGAADRALALDLAGGDAEPDDASVAELPDEERAAVLTLAHDALSQRSSGEERSRQRGRALALLGARAQVPVQGESTPPVPVPTVRPDEGHESARLRAGVGVRDGKMFIEAGLRPAFHDLVDPPGGYLRGAQVGFLDFALRYYPQDSELKLERLTVLDIVSIAPRDALFDPVSWSFKTGFESHLVPKPHLDFALRDSLFYRTRGGPGLARRLGPARAYGFVEGTFDVASALQPAFGLGAGLRVGLQAEALRDRYGVHLFAEATRFFAGDVRTEARVGFDQRITLTRNTALELAIAAEHDFDETWLDAGLFLRFYF